MDTKKPKDQINIADFAYSGYSQMAADRRIVADCVAGQNAIKAAREKYLPADKWQIKNPRDYAAYLNRALFFKYTRKALNRYVGMLDQGEPNISLPENGELDFLQDNATVYGYGLKALQRKINLAQLKDGLICLLLESTGKDNEPFIIQNYRAEDFLRADFRVENGKSYPYFILLDESTYKFNPVTKTDAFVQQLRVLGLDARGNYYQAAIKPEDWGSFDIENPPENATYPTYRAKMLNRIPFTWCGASGLSGVTLDEPPLLGVANADISLYQLYADVRQVRYMTGQSPLFITGLKGQADSLKSQINELYVNSGAINALPEGAHADYLTMATGSINALMTEIDNLKSLCTEDALSISATAKNQSGVAVQLIQDSNLSPLQIINSVAADALTEQLRFAGRWIGLKEEDIQNISYSASRDFAKAKLTIQELAGIEESKYLLDDEKRKIFIENGYGDPKVTPEEFIERRDAEREKENPFEAEQKPGNPFENNNGTVTQ